MARSIIFFKNESTSSRLEELPLQHVLLPFACLICLGTILGPKAVRKASVSKNRGRTKGWLRPQSSVWWCLWLLFLSSLSSFARMHNFLNLGGSFGTTERDRPLDFRPRGKPIRPSLSGVGESGASCDCDAPHTRSRSESDPTKREGDTYHGETNTGSGGLSKARRKEQQVRIVACNARSCCHLFGVIFRYKNG